jgi:integrase
VIQLPQILLAIMTDQWRTKPRDCPWVFHRYGVPIRSFYAAWRTAVKEAGLVGRIPHDFRRTAVRNLVRAGVPERVAMAICGHKTRAVFDRYNIVSEQDLRDAAERMSAFSMRDRDNIGTMLSSPTQSHPQHSN